MKTKISLKDVVETEIYCHEIGMEYCLTCMYSIDNFENSSYRSDRCADCKLRVAPPTRWRGKK